MMPSHSKILGRDGITFTDHISKQSWSNFL